MADTDTTKAAPQAADREQVRWSDIEHLTEWDEEFYNVYTAKKFGKWVMFKTLRPEIKDDPKYQEMIAKEFDVRYNLAHPHIVMTNDFEDVPGVGMSIVFDDVYGLSLRKLIDEGKITEHHIKELRTSLISAMEYIQEHHLEHRPIRPETIIFTENIENLKLIDVGFDQHSKLAPTSVADDIYSYGITMREVLDKTPDYNDPELRAVVERCIDADPRRRYRSVRDLHMALEGRSPAKVYTFIIAFLALVVILLIAMRLIGV